jgi:tetratricopeptide (TPR) repeat protein
MKSSITREWAHQAAKESARHEGVAVQASRPTGRPLSIVRPAIRVEGRRASIPVLLAAALVLSLLVAVASAAERAREEAFAQQRVAAAVSRQKEAEDAQHDAEQRLAELQAEVDVLTDEVNALTDRAGELRKALDARERVAEQVRADLARRTPGERADMFWTLGKDRLRGGALDDADFFFDQANIEKKDFAPAWLGHGEIASRRGDLEGAVRFYGKSVAADPSYKQGYLMAAWAQCNLGHYDEAEKAAQEALKIDPTYKGARQVLAAIDQKRPKAGP